MAKKNLTPYQKARRQYVQARLAQRGLEGTSEERANIRQRFDVLAQTKQGRTKIAQRSLPNAPQEERRNFKRMLATELPPRKTTTTTTTSTPPVTSYTADQIARIRAGAAIMGPQLSQVMVGPQLSQVTTSPKTGTSSTSKKTWVDNSVVQGVRKGLISVVPGLSDVDQSRKEFDKGNVVGGIGRLAFGTAQTAAFVGSLFGLGGGTTPSTITRTTSRTKISTIRPTPPKIGKGAPARPTAPKTNKGAPTRPQAPGTKFSKKSKSATSKPKTSKPATSKPATSKPATSKPATSKPATSKPATKRMSKETLKIDGEEVKVADTVAERTATSKPATSPKPAAKPTAKQQPTVKPPKDMPLNTQGNYPGARTDADFNFIKKLTEAQQEINRQGPKWLQYKKWLDSPLTQATIKRLRGK